MGKIFDLDSPVMRFLTKVSELMLLNILTLVCCLPIITAGASVTAMHYVALKLARGEEGYITRSFFRSFKRNFKQATLIWLLMLLITLVFVGDYFIVKYSGLTFHPALQIVLTAIAIMFFLLSTYIFPVLARFDNTVKNTIKNGCIMSVIAFPKAIIIAILTILPPVFFFRVPVIIPVVLLFGFSLPGYLSARLYSGTFRRFEPEEEEELEEEEFHVTFDDEEITTL